MRHFIESGDELKIMMKGIIFLIQPINNYTQMLTLYLKQYSKKI